MNIKFNICRIETLRNITKQGLVAVLLATTLGCGKWVHDGMQPEVIRSIEYRDDDQSELYDIEYENNILCDRDDECIMFSREGEKHPRNTKKIVPDTLSVKKK